MSQVIDNIYIERKSVKWLTDQIKNELLFVDNSFQRHYVWTVKNQMRLIETILVGYAIPEIYIWERETDSLTGSTKLSIVDGQQRLGAIADFINDKFALKVSAIDNKSASFAGKKFSDLSEDERNTIWRYPFSVRFIRYNVERDDIVKMFLRLNSTSASLNPQELRNAEFGGEFIRLANDIADNDFWGRNESFNVYDLRRMLDIEFISSILIFFRLGIEEETTQSALNKAYDTFNEKYDEAEQDKNLFLQLLEMADQVINGKEEVKKFLKKKVHLYTLITALYYFYKKYGKLTEENVRNYYIFISAYNEDKSYQYLIIPKSISHITDSLITLNFITKYSMLVGEYKKLSNEGTQKKTNRLRRMEIVRSIMEGYDHLSAEKLLDKSPLV